MTKRLLTLLMALLLLAGCVPAQAEEAAGPVVTLLDGAGQAGGQGVLLEAGQEVLVPASLAETAGLQVQAGEEVLSVLGVAASGASVTMLRLEEEAGDPLPLAAEDPAVFSQVEAVSDQWETASCTVLTRVSLADGWGFTFRDETDTAQPGGALLNGAGELAGLVLGTWADMPNAKVALGAEAIAALQGNTQTNVREGSARHAREQAGGARRSRGQARGPHCFQAQKGRAPSRQRYGVPGEYLPDHARRG